MNSFQDEIKSKKVLVFGLGRQGGGVGDAAWLKAHGAVVRISDTDVTLATEGQTKEQIDWAEIIIKNPGVSDDNELILYAKKLGRPVLTSIAVFNKYAKIKTIGVTGTRGKSTTVALITALLERVYPGQIITGGNIALTSCLALFDQIENKKFAVLELSSFQLHNFHDLRVSPHIAVITNLYPDHLNRYSNMEAYQYDKTAICAYQQKSDLCLYNADNPGSVRISESAPAKRIAYASSQVMDMVTPLPGLHNRENIAAAVCLAKELGLDPAIVAQVVSDFKGIPYRQEPIATKDGVVYINDTTATTPTAALYALRSATSPTIWITGGDTKHLPFDTLLDEVKTNPHLKQIVILGSKNIPDYTAALTKIAANKILGTALSMSEAVELARQSAVSGDTILLSPGFSSFDLFQNEFDRGRQFNDSVANI